MKISDSLFKSLLECLHSSALIRATTLPHRSSFVNKSHIIATTALLNNFGVEFLEKLVVSAHPDMSFESLREVVIKSGKKFADTAIVGFKKVNHEE